MTDTEIVEWLERQCVGCKVIVGRNRVTGRFRLVAADTASRRGYRGLRRAVERAVEKERRLALGFKR